MARTKKVGSSRKSLNKNGTKKRVKTNYSNFKMYIHKILKQVDMGRKKNKKDDKLTISKKAMVIVNDFMIDIFQRIAGEAAQLAIMDKHRSGNKNAILSSRHIQTAMHFHLSGELCINAKAEGIKAVRMYLDS